MLTRLTIKTSVLIVALALMANGQSAPSRKADLAKALPRTADGHPDLQGNWLNQSATPFERPKELAGHPQLTDAEVVELNARAKKIFGNPKSDAASADGVFMAAYNNLEVYKSGGATDSAERVTEMFIDNRTSLITDPADGRVPALTPGGQRRRAAYGKSRAGNGDPSGPEDIAPGDRCITYGVPRITGVYSSGLHGYYQIVQTHDSVVFFAENIHEVREFSLNGRPHPPASVKSWSGDSTAKWEGDSLIVETTNFISKLNTLGISDNVRLTERFTRVSTNEIQYEMKFDYPETWVKPWTAMIKLTRTEDRLFETACHEGNDRIMETILVGDRRK